MLRLQPTTVAGQTVRTSSTFHFPNINNTGTLSRVVHDADSRMGLLDTLLNYVPPPWDIFNPPPQMKAHFQSLAAAMQWGLRMEYQQYLLLWQCSAWVGLVCSDHLGGGKNGENNFVKILIRLVKICMPQWVKKFPQFAHLAFDLMARPESQPNTPRVSGTIGDLLLCPLSTPPFHNQWSAYNFWNAYSLGCTVIEVSVLNGLNNTPIKTYGGLSYRQRKALREQCKACTHAITTHLFVPSKQHRGEEVVLPKIEATLRPGWAWNDADAHRELRLIHLSEGRNYQPDPILNPDVWENLDTSVWQYGFENTQFPPVGTQARFWRSAIEERWAEYCTRLAVAKHAALNDGSDVPAPTDPGCTDQWPTNDSVHTMDLDKCDNCGYAYPEFIMFPPPKPK